MRIAFHHTHVYPGCTATVCDPPAAGAGPVEAAVEFSDGVVTGAACTATGEDGLRLALDPHRTARGTAIAAKTWLLRRVARHGERWVVQRRLAAT